MGIVRSSLEWLGPAAILRRLMLRLEGLRFLYVTGKGGVGKSTVSAALGAQLAASGRRVLLAFAAESLGQSRLLGRPIAHEPTEVLPGLFALGIDADESMQEYATSVLGSRRVAAVLFHTSVARGFLHGIPGLRAWAFLGKSWYFADPEGGGPEEGVEPFDTVIVDAPATGDATDVLRVPTVIRELAPRGRLRDDADACVRMLRDPRRTAVVPVTILEDLPVTELEELVGVVRGELRLPLGPVLVNRVTPRLFDSAARERLAAAAFAAERAFPPPRDQPGESVLDLAARHALREREGEELRARVDALGCGRLELPEQGAPPAGAADLVRLGAAITAPA
jgi:anion-transporting  ArsA/GET3 family ATPase